MDWRRRDPSDAIARCRKSLSLGCAFIGDIGATALANALCVDRVLTKLDLSCNSIEPTGATALADALRVNGALTALDVSYNNLMTEEAALGIVRVEQQRNKLTSLGLAGCGIGPAGAAGVAEYVSGSGVLKSLYLDNNHIGDTGAVAIAEALRGNGVLTDLNLTNNNITGRTDGINASEVEGESKEVGAKVIYQGREMIVRWMYSYGELELEDPTGVIAIAKVLEVNGVLTKLDLGCNNIGPTGATALADALKVNGVLKNINLDYNILGDEGRKAIRDAVSGREGFELKM